MVPILQYLGVGLSSRKNLCIHEKVLHIIGRKTLNVEVPGVRSNE